MTMEREGQREREGGGRGEREGGRETERDRDRGEGGRERDRERQRETETESERETDSRKPFLRCVGIDLIIPPACIDKFGVRSATQRLEHGHISLRWYVSEDRIYVTTTK